MTTVGMPRRSVVENRSNEQTKGKKQTVHHPSAGSVRRRERPDVAGDEPQDPGQPQQTLPPGEGTEEKLDDGDDQEEHPHRGVPDNVTAMKAPGVGTGPP